MGICLPVAATIVAFGMKAVAQVVSELRAEYGVVSNQIAGINEAVGRLKGDVKDLFDESRRQWDQQ